MAEVLGVIPKLVASYRRDDDRIDRLNHHVTTAVLTLFALLVNFVEFLNVQNIVCWAPVHFSDYQENYADQYCWVKNTYYLPFTEVNIPREGEKRAWVTYYQWVPFILLVQALLFHIPCTFWRTYNKRCGLNVAEFVEKSQALPILDQLDIGESHEKTLTHLAALMDRFANGQRKYSKACTLSLKHVCSSTCLRPLRSSKGRYLISLYLVIKLLYLANALGQIFILDKFLGMDYHSYGFQVLDEYVKGGDWTASRAFPRVTLCDFKVRRLGNVQRYTVQCALPINLYNEKIFLVVYFWLIMVAFLTLVTLIRWVVMVGTASRRLEYVRRHVQQATEARSRYLGQKEEVGNLNEQEETIRFFTEEYLRADGVFLLRLAGQNIDVVAEEDLVYEVWTFFLSRQKQESQKHNSDVPNGSKVGILV